MAGQLDTAGRYYIDGYLFKKEAKWIKYWIVLQGRFLLIHDEKPKAEESPRDVLLGWIEINSETKCIMGKKRSYSFPFYIQTKKKKYLFKTESTLVRHRWVTAIKLCSQGKSPDLIPRHLAEVERDCKNHVIDNPSNMNYPLLGDEDGLSVEDLDLPDEKEDERWDAPSCSSRSSDVESTAPNFIFVSSPDEYSVRYSCKIKDDDDDDCYESSNTRLLVEEQSDKINLSPRYSSYSAHQSPGPPTKDYTETFQRLKVSNTVNRDKLEQDLDKPTNANSLRFSRYHSHDLKGT